LKPRNPELCRLGIDLTALNPSYQGGVSRYSISLVDAILREDASHRISVFCTKSNIDFLRSRLPNAANLVVLELNQNAITRLIEIFSFWIYPSVRALNFAQFLRYFEYFQKYDSEIDVIYTPTTYTNFRPKSPIGLVSLHDTQEMKFPNFFTLRERKYRKARCISTFKSARCIQVSSNFIMEEILGYFSHHLSRDQISVIPEGVDISYFSNNGRPKNGDRLVLFYPASFLPHKNHKYLFEVLEQIPATINVELRLTGEDNITSRNLIAKLNSLVQSRVVILGKLTEEELLFEYQNCDCVVVSSKYESSSLPILEGIASGAIALASDIPAHIEMSKELPMLIFNLNDPRDLADIIIALRENNSLHENALSFSSHVAKRDWSKIGSEFIELTQKLALENIK
jgi:glycosyltransferase involved in cell wall biosynthesis